MLTKLICRNFKNFGEVEIELGNPVVFIGPNNSGKTTALQALALWEIGLKRWNEKRKGTANPEKRPGVAINRLDLIFIPVPWARLLWRNQRVRDAEVVNGKQRTQNVRIDITVEGVTAGKEWKCGFEFDYANPESFYCRPLRTSEVDGKVSERMPVPEEAANLSVAFLPPMSGLAANETRLDDGAINVRIGEGRTAEVLRNLCYQISQDAKTWERLCHKIDTLFGVRLNRPEYVPGRGEIAMSYREASNEPLDLSSSGRGLQQTLLLLTYVTAHPGSVLLLDEPDAHLEILRQRQIYQVLTDLAREHGSQIIAVSHSEVILKEAVAKSDSVIAFFDQPHPINDNGSPLLKSLRDFDVEEYYLAQQRGWILYIESPTDLPILQAFAEKLGHPVQTMLKTPYIYYVENRPRKARKHFWAMQEAKKDLVGFCLCNRIPKKLHSQPTLTEHAWQRCEIENYIVPNKQVLIEWARTEASKIQGSLSSDSWMSTMDEMITEVEKARATLRQVSPWSPDIKVTDDFLDGLFETFFEKLGISNSMRKANYYTLVQYVPAEQIDAEVVKVLDGILEIAEKAVPLGST